MASSGYALPRHCLSVGDRIFVYRDDDRSRHTGEITAAAGDHGCEVLYENGEREWLSLDKVRYILKKDRKGSNRGRNKRGATNNTTGGGENELKAIENVLFDTGLKEEIVYRRSSRLQKKLECEDTVVCRRSSRLKKKQAFEDNLSPECSEGLLEEYVPSVLCSAKVEDHRDSCSCPSSPEKLYMDDSDSVEIVACNKSKRDCFSSNGGYVCHDNKGKKDHNCRELKQLNRITGVNDDPLEEPADDNVKATACSLTELLCSICLTGVARNFFVQCKNAGCVGTFHAFCIYPPLQALEKDWLCPYCEEDNKFFTIKLTGGRKYCPRKIQSIVGRRRVVLEPDKEVFQDQFLVKWEALSHHHDSWVPLEWLYIFDRARLHWYRKKCPILKETNLVDGRKPEWFKIDRVIACRRKFDSGSSCDIWSVAQAKQDTGEFEFLVKWMGLDYREATWESSGTEELLAEVGKLVERHRRATGRGDDQCQTSSDYDLSKTPGDLYRDTLYDYQLQGLRWILCNFMARRNVILADEMGLGKTVQVVCFVNILMQEKLTGNPVLVIAPKSILYQWDKEFRNWAKDLNVIIYQGDRESRHCIQAHELYSFEKKVLFDVLVTSYELVLWDNSVLKKLKWSAIIVDEAHKLKNLDCKLASCLHQYSSEFRLLLTGTPLQNTLLELFALLHFIDPQKFSDPKAEAESFSAIGKGLQYSDSEKKIAEIHELLKPRMLRRMKSDVLPGSIPIKKWVEVPCALTDFQRDLYINILEKNYQKLNKGILSGQEKSYSSREAGFLSLVATSGKLQLLEKLLPKLKERGNRVLLFSQMTRMLDILEDFLLFLGFAYFRIDGKTPLASRQQQMKEFNSPESEIFIFLMSTRAGGLGIDLPGADRVIIYDPDFNPFVDLQAQCRAHRIGQTRPVVVYQLITKCSIEEKILEKSKQKLAMENLVMNPTRKPTADDLHSVLLHGARTILNRNKVQATSIHYDDDAIKTLLSLDPAPGDYCVPDGNGYLGSIQSFIPGSTETGEAPPSPKAGEWREVLGPVAAEASGDFGRGKRRRKVVDYKVEDASDSDEVYSPEGSSTCGSSSDDSGDDLDPEAAGDKI